MATLEVDDDALVILVGRHPQRTRVYVGDRQIGYIQRVSFEADSLMSETKIEVTLADRLLADQGVDLRALRTETQERFAEVHRLLDPHLVRSAPPPEPEPVRIPAWRRLTGR